jgi:N-acetylglucosamine-6-sulfatase
MATSGDSPPRTRWFVAIGVLVALLGAVIVFVTVRSDGGEPTVEAKPDAPNILVIMTDDQTLESMRVMENVNRLVGAEGTTFSNAFASFPVCCPSRATYLTGQYAHNNTVLDNLPPEGGWHKLKAAEALPVWLQEAGYHTVHVGKYLNGWGSYSPLEPPPGWDEWFGLIDPTTYRYFGFSASVNGERRDFPADDANYQTDVLVREVQRNIEAGAGQDGPWFISFTPLAPHFQNVEGEPIENRQEENKYPQAAPRHRGAFADEPLPRPPSFDLEDVSGKPGFVQERSRLGPTDLEWMTQAYRAELRSLLAVDEGVAAIVDTLQRTGQLENTAIIFTSDHGAFHGEQRIRSNKYYLYEPAVRVPLYIRGAGFPKGRVAEQVVVNADLAPTIAAMAGVTPNASVDGIDLAPFTTDATIGRDRGILLENFHRKQPTATAIRTSQWFYAEHSTGEVELYDMEVDPYQLKNLAGRPEHAADQQQLRDRLVRLRTCAGDTCHGS